MLHRIMTRKATLFIILLIFLAFVASDISHGNPNALARKVYNKHTRILMRADVQEVLPDVLNKLKAPAVQPLLSDTSIKLIANNPDILKSFLPDVDGRFVRLLKTDAQFKKLIRDADFQKVLQNPAAINALAALMTGNMPPEESWVFFKEFSYPTILNGERLGLKFTGLKHGQKYRPGSKHKVILTLTSRRLGKPVPSARLSLSYYKNLPATATFRPAVITTNKNGKAETQITLGKKPGDLGISVEMKHEGPRVTFGTYDYSTLFVDGEELVLKLDGLASNTIPYRPGSKHKVIFTVTKGQDRKPVPFVRLSLSKRTGSRVPVTFRPAVITTNKNGKAETQITLPKAPGSVFSISVHMEHENRVIYEALYTHTFSVDGEEVDMTHNLRSNVAYRPGSKHKVIFTVIKERTRKPVPFVRLSVSTHRDSTTTATFRPAAITTDKNGKAETQITFGKKPGRISMNVNMKFMRSARAATRVFFWIRSHTAYVDGKEVNLKENLSSITGYLPGSKHKLIFTLTNKQTGKPVPSARLTLITHRDSTTTATFGSAAITTDKNGKAETQITFGKKPGRISMKVNIQVSREVDFQVGSPRFSGGAGIDMDITFDGASGKISEFSDFSYQLGLTKTRKKLVVKTKSAEQPAKGVPYVDLVFNSVGSKSKGSVTFKPKKVRTDKNGQAVTYITFGAGQTDVQIEVKVNMVLIKVNLIEDRYVLPLEYGYTQQKDGGKVEIQDLEFHAKGKVIHPLHPGTSNSGVLPLNTAAHLQFDVIQHYSGESRIRPYSLYIISGKNYADIKLNQGYATSDKNGLVKIRMNTGLKPGVVVINLNPPKSAQLKGTLLVKGSNSEGFLLTAHRRGFVGSHDLPSRVLGSKEKFQHLSKTTFRAHNEIRVEMSIAARKVRSTGVEIGAYVKFYEGATSNTNDLEDINSRVFLVPWESVPKPFPLKPPYIGLYNGDTSISHHKRMQRKYRQPTNTGEVLLVDIYPDIATNTDHLGDQEGGDWVEVRFYLDAVPVYKGGLFASAFNAPQAVTANLFSFSDVNVDGQVNVTDLILVSNTLEQTDLANLNVDVNNDGIFTIADLVQVAQHLGQLSGPDTPAALVVPEGLTYATVEEWIASARAVDDGSLVFRQGIANLELLLTLIIPEKTALLSELSESVQPRDMDTVSSRSASGGDANYLCHRWESCAAFRFGASGGWLLSK